MLCYVPKYMGLGDLILVVIFFGSWVWRDDVQYNTEQAFKRCGAG